MFAAPGGILPPVPTLLTADGSVDDSRFRALVDHLEQVGVDGVVVLGTSGEGMVLPDRHREAALAAVADSRLTRIVGCPGQSPAEVLARLEVAATYGATYGLVTPPYYYPHDQTALIDFFVGVADRSPVPILLYHIPQLTRNALTPETIGVLANHDGIVGVKDSHGQAVEQARILALQSPRFSVLQGLAPLLLYSYALGAAGSITPVGALYPNLELKLRGAVQEGDIDAAADFQRQINTVAGLFRSGGHTLVANLKCVAHLLGYGTPTVFPPGRAAPDDQLVRLTEGLASVGLLPDG